MLAFARRHKLLTALIVIIGVIAVSTWNSNPAGSAETLNMSVEEQIQTAGRDHGDCASKSGLHGGKKGGDCKPPECPTPSSFGRGGKDCPEPPVDCTDVPLPKECPEPPIDCDTEPRPNECPPQTCEENPNQDKCNEPEPPEPPVDCANDPDPDPVDCPVDIGTGIQHEKPPAAPPATPVVTLTPIPFAG